MPAAGDVDQADEMDAPVVEAVPALAPGPLAESFEILGVADHVMLAWNVGDMSNLRPLENLGDGVELPGRGEMCEVAGVDQQFRPSRKRIDLVDGCLQRTDDVLVRFLGEADVAIADLNEREAPGPGSVGACTEDPGRKDATTDRPYQARASPGHALQESAAIDSITVVFTVNLMRHIQNPPKSHLGAVIGPATPP